MKNQQKIKQMKTKTGWTATLLCCVVACLFAACDKESEEQPVGAERGERLSVETSLQDFATEGQPNTRATINAGVTTFKAGDEIGVFAMKNGSLVADCNNVKLTYQANGKWSGADIYDYGGGSTYLAYYPYRVEMNGKTSLDAIKSAFTISNTQNTPELLAANDLVTASTTVSDRKLVFTFTHAFCLLEFQEEAKVKGRKPVTEQDISSYEFYLHRDASLNAIVIKDGSGAFLEPVYMYNAGNDLYRCIINPVTVSQVIFSYQVAGTTTPLKHKENEGDPQAFYITYSATYAAGNYYRMNVGTVNYWPVDGDFIYKDASLLPAECTTDLDAANCVGVLHPTVQAGNSSLPPPLNDSNVRHLTVMALHDAATCVFSTVLPERLDLDVSGGYLETKYYAEKGADAYPAAYAAFHYKGTLPDVPNSGWYLSLLLASLNPGNAARMNAALTKIGGTPLTGIYWCNSVMTYSDDPTKRTILCHDMTALTWHNRYSYSETHKVRPIFFFQNVL